MEKEIPNITNTEEFFRKESGSIIVLLEYTKGLYFKMENVQKINYVFRNLGTEKPYHILCLR